MSEIQSPSAIASEYFARMRAGDVRVVDLFHEDAELIGLGTRRQGRASILEFYRGVIERAGPTPSLVGSLLASGERVAAEILIELGDGGQVAPRQVRVAADVLEGLRHSRRCACNQRFLEEANKGQT